MPLHVRTATAFRWRPTVIDGRREDVVRVHQDGDIHLAPATAVLRFDSIDVRSTIERLIDCYEPDPRHGDWLLSWSRSNRALPASFDMGGVLGLKPDGRVLSVAWDAPESSTREETSPAAHLAATVGALLLYPSLKTLAPRSPEPARACSHCGTTSAGEGPGCPLCWYLGWMPPEPPEWFHRPTPVPTSAQGSGEPDGRKPWWRRILGGSS